MPKIKITWDELRKCLAKGMTQAEIAKKHDLAKSTVCERVKKLQPEMAHEVALEKADDLLKVEFDAIKQIMDTLGTLSEEHRFIKEKLKNCHEKFRKGWQRQLVLIDGEIRRWVALLAESMSRFTAAEQVAQMGEVLGEVLDKLSPEAKNEFFRLLEKRGVVASSYRRTRS